MSRSVAVTVADGIAEVRLNRPDVLNALDAEMAIALDRALQMIVADQSVRCVQLCGAGPAFMAGGDLSYFKQAPPELRRGRDAGLEPIFGHVHAVVTTLRSMPQPVVARVHGAIASFGMSLMMACDLVVAAAGSRFALAYCGIGTSPDGGATFALPRTVGVKRAMELALLGERFDSTRALELGLVNWVVPDDELEKQCDGLLSKLAQGPARAYAHTKQLINQSFDNDLAAQLAREKAFFLDCAASSDFEEGITAFLKKGKPRFGE